ncbi:MAG: hypothetical protein K6A41_10845 [Bacteroidales bacterium]|nr:hypothetical protein [Bacteroidales bacterium]
MKTGRILDKSSTFTDKSSTNSYVFVMGKWGYLGVEVGFRGQISEEITSSLSKPNIENEVFSLILDTDCSASENKSFT